MSMRLKTRHQHGGYKRVWPSLMTGGIGNKSSSNSNLKISITKNDKFVCYTMLNLCDAVKTRVEYLWGNWTTWWRRLASQSFHHEQSRGSLFLELLSKRVHEGVVSITFSSVGTSRYIVVSFSPQNGQPLYISSPLDGWAFLAIFLTSLNRASKSGIHGLCRIILRTFHFFHKLRLTSDWAALYLLQQVNPP